MTYVAATGLWTFGLWAVSSWNVRLVASLGATLIMNGKFLHYIVVESRSDSFLLGPLCST